MIHPSAVVHPEADLPPYLLQFIEPFDAGHGFQPSAVAQDFAPRSCQWGSTQLQCP